jgi:hypothetical protein
MLPYGQLRLVAVTSSMSISIMFSFSKSLVNVRYIDLQKSPAFLERHGFTPVEAVE